MKSTPYHASYYAHSLTLKHPSDDIQKLTAALGDARVDLNPHQVLATPFSIDTPLKRACFVDEWDIGKLLRQVSWLLKNGLSIDDGYWNENMTKQDKQTPNQGWGQIGTLLSCSNIRKLEKETGQKVVTSLNAKSTKEK